LPLLPLSTLFPYTTLFRSFVRWQAAVQGDLLGVAEPKFLAECLDGRLTGLDRLVALHPVARATVRRGAAELDLLPRPVARALSRDRKSTRLNSSHRTISYA